MPQPAQKARKIRQLSPLQPPAQPAYLLPVSDAAAPGKELDLRTLTGAEPIIRILRELETIKPGETLKVQLSSVPFQLYDLVQQRGCFIKYDRQGSQAIGTITRR